MKPKMTVKGNALIVSEEGAKGIILNTLIFSHLLNEIGVDEQFGYICLADREGVLEHVLHIEKFFDAIPAFLSGVRGILSEEEYDRLCIYHNMCSSIRRYKRTELVHRYYICTICKDKKLRID